MPAAGPMLIRRENCTECAAARGLGDWSRCKDHLSEGGKSATASVADRQRPNPPPKPTRIRPGPAGASRTAPPGRIGYGNTRRRCPRGAAIRASVPCSAMVPSRNTRIRSQRRTVDSRWAMMKVVRPCISRSIPAMTSASVATSSAEVGSSRIRIGASRNSARAIVMRCFSPSDSDDAGFAELCRSPPAAGDHVVDPGQPSRLLDLRMVGAGPAIGDIVAHRKRKDQRRLQDHGDLAAQRFELVFAHIDAVDLDAARRSDRKTAATARAASICRRRSGRPSRSCCRPRP